MGQGTPETATVRGVVSVLERGREWLMIQRAEAVVLGGAWCFPGGTIEHGETPAGALVREIREELNLAIRPTRAVWRWRRDDGALEIEWWQAEVIGGTPRPNPAEVQSIRWMTPETIRATPGVLRNNLEFLDFAERSGLVFAG